MPLDFRNDVWRVQKLAEIQLAFMYMYNVLRRLIGISYTQYIATQNIIVFILKIN